MRKSLYIILVLLICSTAFAQIYSYVDSRGKEWFVNVPEEVPVKYRDQIKVSEIKETSSSNKSVSNQSQPKVEIFLTDWCPYCQKMEKFFKDNNIQYTSYNIEKSSVGRQKYNALGYNGVPVTKVGRQVISGYAPDKVLKAIKNN